MATKCSASHVSLARCFWVGFAALCIVSCGNQQSSEPTHMNGSGMRANAPAQPVTEELSVWHLDGAASSISFISIKADEIAETHTFETISGAVQISGAVELEIDLASVETNIDIRNERLRELFFQTDTFPMASITSNLDMSALTVLGPGDQRDFSVSLSLNLHGFSESIDASLIVTRLDEDTVSVTTLSPIVVNVADFQLSDGLERLREAAKLPSITPVSPVSALLIFKRETGPGDQH